MLTAAREQRGYRIDVVAVDVYRILGSRRGMSREILRKIESGETPLEKVTPVTLSAICQVLGIDLRAVSPEHADELEALKDNLHSLRGKPQVAA
jgi:transcriptional regulator with XRE-family HTH domain